MSIIVVYNFNVAFKLCTLEIDRHELHILLIYWPIYAKFCENIVRLINNLCGKLSFHWMQWTDVSKIEDLDPLHKDLKFWRLD